MKIKCQDGFLEWFDSIPKEDHDRILDFLMGFKKFESFEDEGVDEFLASLKNIYGYRLTFVHGIDPQTEEHGLGLVYGDKIE